ncbi:hypothetical protein [Microbacterium sp. TPD7012]|uniref:hypothetical protein n=1 Tax=Microbacterium sp. TPD7012 TaxID=2171975 RepID=UPI000D50DF16|nr:hypothetical protein [Microbacterium sp. TPD7012]PVE95601.1 hypothetical protein DC434_08610 [Microbacterium sp. TPD7012]
MTEVADARFELRKVVGYEWLILDHRYEVNDPRRTVGCVYQVDEYEVEVSWMREIPLARRYMTPLDALQELLRFENRSRSTRPIEIPHQPPLMAPAPTPSSPL